MNLLLFFMKIHDILGNFPKVAHINVLRSKKVEEIMVNKITVSFKSTTKDMKLFVTVNSQEEKSDFVKKALEYYIKHLEMENSKDV